MSKELLIGSTGMAIPMMASMEISPKAGIETLVIALFVFQE